MMNMINRRQFLQITGAGAAGLLAGGLPSLINIEDARAASNPEGKFIPDRDIALKASPDCFWFPTTKKKQPNCRPGTTTSPWSFRIAPLITATS